MALRIAGVGRVIVSDLSSTCRIVFSFGQSLILGLRLYRISIGALQGGMCAILTVPAN
jgi:hypothetical protein